MKQLYFKIMRSLRTATLRPMFYGLLQMRRNIQTENKFRRWSRWTDFWNKAWLFFAERDGVDLRGQVLGVMSKETRKRQNMKIASFLGALIGALLAITIFVDLPQPKHAQLDKSFEAKHAQLDKSFDVKRGGIR